jgi:hypothetical protein
MSYERGYLVLGWMLDAPRGGFAARDVDALMEALSQVGDGWAAVAHGTMPNFAALSVCAGVVVASAELDPASGGIADDGLAPGEEDELERSEIDPAAMTLARKRLRSAKAAALALLRARGYTVSDAAKPAVWLLVTGASTTAVLHDAKDTRYRCTSEGEPRALKKLAPGALRWTVY